MSIFPKPDGTGTSDTDSTGSRSSSTATETPSAEDKESGKVQSRPDRRYGYSTEMEDMAKFEKIVRWEKTTRKRERKKNRGRLGWILGVSRTDGAQRGKWGRRCAERVPDQFDTQRVRGEGLMACRALLVIFKTGKEAPIIRWLIALSIIIHPRHSLRVFHPSATARRIRMGWGHTTAFHHVAALPTSRREHDYRASYRRALLM